MTKKINAGSKNKMTKNIKAFASYNTLSNVEIRLAQVTLSRCKTCNVVILK